MTRPHSTRSALAAALFLSSCSSPASDGHTDHPQTDQPVITGAAGRLQRRRCRLRHQHDSAPPAGRGAVGAGSRPLHQSRTRSQLANQISAAQQPEINTMKVFLVQWNENPDTNSGHAGHSGHGTDAGHGRRGDHGAAGVAERRGVRQTVAGVDDRPPPGRDRNGQGRDRQRRQCGRQDAGQRTSSPRSKPRSAR